jgi:pilus assembly protein FimV
LVVAHNRDVNVDMHRWKFSALASAAYLCAALTSTDAAALALGSISVQSYLGQPLRAEVDVPQLSSAEASSLETMVATPDIFQAHGMEYGNTARTLQVKLQRRPDGSAKLQLSTSAPVNEPFVDIILQANWNAGNLVRSYTLLLDPAPSAVRKDAKVGGTPVQVSPPAQTASSYQSQPRARTTAPATSATAAASLSTPAGESVTVRPGDTAGRIAGANRLAGVSLDQMLVAMLQSNPHAFIDGNVNRIRAGTVIKLPSQEQAQSTSAPEARKIIAAQSRNFNAFRQKLASRTADAQLEAADRTATGKVQAQVADDSPAAAPADKLTLSKGAISAQAEDKLAKQKQASAQDERMQELQRNLAELDALNKKAPDSTPSATGTVDANTTQAVAVPATAAEPAANATPSGVAVTTNLPADPNSTTLVPPQADMQAAPTAESEAPKPTPQPKKKPAPPPPPPPPEPSFLESLLSNPLVPAGGAAAALLAGLLVWRSRKQKAAAAGTASTLDSAQLPPDSLFDSSGGQQVDTSNDGSASTMTYTPSQLDANGDVDPIAEADVYLAYNKDEEAQKILRDALHNAPSNLPVHLKLAQIHAKNQELPQLESVARAIHRLTNGQGDDWKQVRTLGRNTDPNNPFYAEESVGAASEPAPSSGFAQALAASSAAAPAMDLDFDLDLDAGAPAKAVKQPELPEEDPLIAALDSQLDILAPQTHSEMPSQIIDTQFAQDLLDPSPTTDTSAPLDLGNFGDLNLDLPASTPAPVQPSAPAQSMAPEAPSSLEGLDFSLDTDFSLPAAAPAAPAPAPAAPAAAPEDDFGLSQLDLSNDFSLPSAEASPGANIDIDIDIDAMADTGADSAPTMANDALGTKLDLAQEFAAIGDSEGARSLIEEVLTEASGTLKVRAEKMLSELD